MEKLPLSSVRTFSVVARLLSISRAAEQLSVTPSAVSHQVRILEQYLGTTLFKRERNRLTLTAAGQHYMAQVSEAMMMLSRATQTIKAARGQHVLRVVAPPSVSCLWLAARIAKFMERHPDIGVTLSAAPYAPSLLQGAFDMGLWYGGGVIPGLVVEPIAPTRIFPICKPSLTDGDPALRAPEDLAKFTMLDSTDDAADPSRQVRAATWPAWLAAARMPDVMGARYLNYTPRVLMHKVVAAGLGVGLSSTLLAADAIEANEVTVPFGPAPTDSGTYNVVYPTQLAKRKDIIAFCRWLVSEGEASRLAVDKVLAGVAPKRRGPS
jgi:LysR family glycine cleavage system transcriptional activator